MKRKAQAQSSSSQGVSFGMINAFANVGRFILAVVEMLQHHVF